MDVIFLNELEESVQKHDQVIMQPLPIQPQGQKLDSKFLERTRTKELQADRKSGEAVNARTIWQPGVKRLPEECPLKLRGNHHLHGLSHRHIKTLTPYW